MSLVVHVGLAGVCTFVLLGFVLLLLWCVLVVWLLVVCLTDIVCYAYYGVLRWFALFGGWVWLEGMFDLLVGSLVVGVFVVICFLVCVIVGHSVFVGLVWCLCWAYCFTRFRVLLVCSFGWFLLDLFLLGLGLVLLTLLLTLIGLHCCRLLCLLLIDCV